MLGISWFIMWQLVGICVSLRRALGEGMLRRLWLGSVLGTLLSMWTPIPFAFFLGFSRAAHALAVVLGLAIALPLCFFPAPRPETDLRSGVDRPLIYLLPLFMALGVTLTVSHTLKPVDGALYTGQCTFGDMPMHLGFITSLAVQQTFPPVYSIFPTARLCYPFLCDSVSASLYLLGTPLRWAYVIPMGFALLQVFCGVWVLAVEVCRQRGAAVLAFLLFFLNGGLGMIYILRYYSLGEMMTGFYITPTNLTEHGIRWVNVIVDMLIPQRATLFGWAALTAALYLLFRAVFRVDRRCFLPAGIIGGLLPMVHTHSYLALGLMAAAWLVYDLLLSPFSREKLTGWLRFALPAVLLALPQLLLWTFRSVEGSSSFLRLGLDWVNNGQESWLRFWVKNVGPLFLIAPAALLLGDREDRAVFSGAAFIFLLGELVIFQPNTYDNNKLFYIAYLFACFLCADRLVIWLRALRRPALRRGVTALLLLLCFNAAIFTLARELVSGVPEYGYRLFSSEEVSAAEYISKNTEPDSVFLTRDNHDNTVAALTGRSIVCGSGSYLYYHGLDYMPVTDLAYEMLREGELFEANREALGVDYVYLGDHERAIPDVIEDYFLQNYPAVYSDGEVRIFKIS